MSGTRVPDYVVAEEAEVYERYQSRGPARYVDALRRHAVLLVAFVVIGVVGATILASSGSRYEATSRVLLRPDDPVERLDPASSATPVRSPEIADRNLDNQVEIIESPPVAAAAVERLRSLGVRRTRDDVLRRTSAVQSGPTDVIDVVAVSDVAEEAAPLANAVASAYIDNRRERAIEGLQAARSEVGSTMDDLSEVINRTAPGPSDTPQEIASGQETRDSLALQYQSLSERRQELTIEIGLKRGEAELVAAAEEPSEESNPPPARAAAVGGFVGLLMGAGFALLRDQLDERVRDPEELELLLDDPVVARVRAHDLEGSLGDPARTISPHLQTVRAAMLLACSGTTEKRVLVTSAGSSSTTTLLAASLAMSCARAGQRTVLVAPQPEHLAVRSLLAGCSDARGLVDVLAEPSPSPVMTPAGTQGAVRSPETVDEHREWLASRLASVVLPTAEPDLQVLPVGSAGETLASASLSERFVDSSHILAGAFDIVIVDGSSLAPAEQAAPLAGSVDVVILVAKLQETRRSPLNRAIRLLRLSQLPVCGVAVEPQRRFGRRR